MSVKQLADDWIADRLAAGSISLNTYKTYGQHFRSLFTVVDPDLDIGELTTAHLRAWMRSQGTMSQATKATRLSAFRSFLDYCVREGLIDANPADRVERPRIEQRKPRPASLTDISAVLAAAGKDIRNGRRICLMVLLECEMGLRRAETAGLRVEDIDWDDRIVLVRGKGRKERHVPLTAGVSDVLTLYLRQTKLTDGPLFRNQRTGEALTPASVGWLISRAGRRAGTKVTAHNYRHRAGTDIARSHGIHVAQHLLGHSSVSTTQVYAQVDLDQVRAALADRSYA